MKTIEELLRNLSRPEVLEFGLVTNRLPSVNIGGKFEPVDDEAPSNERLMQMLVTMGGSRYVDTLGEKPVQWTTRLDGVGVIAVAAILRKDVIQARFTVAKRETSTARPPSDKAVPAAKPASGRSPAARPSGPPPLKPQPSPQPPPLKPQPSPQPPPLKPQPSPQPPPLKPSSAPRISVKTEAAKPSVPPPLPVSRLPQPLADLPLLDDATDDNEPTLQTQSPPGKSTGAVGDAPRPLPARRPEDVRGASTDEALRAKPPSAPAAASGARRVPTPTSVDASASIDTFFAMAAAARATELLIAAGRPISLRVVTELVPRTQPVPAELVERIVKEIVPPRLRDVLERDGSCAFTVDHPTHGRFRANVSKVMVLERAQSKQPTGFKASFRVIPRTPHALAALGLPDALADGVRHPRGLVLVTGPAGQGKSTTLAALVDRLNEETAQHVLTIEDPIEYVHARKRALVSQREVGLHGPSLGAMVRAALRDDVDTLALGEIRDVEAMRHALLACESGRLVLATMNAPSAAKAIERVFELFPAEEEAWVRASLASAMRLVVGQRLLPSADRARLHAAVELLPWSVALHALLREGRSFHVPEHQKRGKAVGVLRMEESIAELVRAQKVTAEVAKQHSEPTQDLEGPSAGRPAPTVAAQARKAST